LQQLSYHHGDLRNSLVSVGIDMLNDKGISGISMREIARNIGVGHNAPYRHFRNKHQLLEAIAEDGFRRLKAKNTRLELEYASDPEEQLFESAIHIISMAAEQSHLYQLMFGGYLKPGECGNGLKKAADEAMQSLVGIIKNGQQQQVFIQGNPTTLALSAMSMIQGVAIMVSSGKLKPQADITASMDRQTILRGMVLQLFDVFLLGLKNKLAE
jgi:AcrR family transcriptional regulator